MAGSSVTSSQPRSHTRPEPRGDAGNGGCIQATSNAVNRRLSGWFYSIGWAVAGRPWAFVVGSVVFVLLCLAGMSNYTTENRPEYLWVPQDSLAQAHLRTYASAFGSDTRGQELVVTAAAGGNVLTNDVVAETQRLFDEVAAISVDVEGSTHNLSTLCAKDATGHCLQASILDLWDYDYVDGSDTDTEIGALVNSSSAMAYNGGPFAAIRSRLIGALQTTPSVSAGALLLTMQLEDNSEVVDGDLVDPAAEAWEERLVEVALAFESAAIRVTPKAYTSLSLEFSAAILGDLGQLGIGYFLIILYLLANLGRWDVVQGRSALALLAVLSIGLAIGADFGLASAFGLFYGPIHSVLPFLLLGIGVDDSFIILDAYEETPAHLTVRERLARALGAAGVSITVTSITDFVAFMVGSSTVLPALSSFSKWAALGVLLVYILQLTLFSAFVALDSRRVAAGTPQCCCLCRRRLPTAGYLRQAALQGVEDRQATNAAEPLPRSELARRSIALDETYLGAAPQLDEQDSQRLCCGSTPLLHFFFGDVLAPLLLSTVGKALVLVGALALLVTMAWSMSNLEQEASDRRFIPDSSYMQTYYDLVGEYFPGQAPLAVVMQPATYVSGEVQQAMDQLQQAVSQSDFAVSDRSFQQPFREWLADQRGVTVDSETLAIDLTDAQYARELADYTSQPAGKQFASLVAFERDDMDQVTGIKASQIFVRLVEVLRTSQQVEVLDGSRELVATSAGSDLLNAFPFSYEFLNWELAASIKAEFIRNVGVTVAAVLVLIVLLVAHPVASLLVFFCVASTLVQVMGTMALWNVAIDSVSTVNISLALGLSVDYSAHIGIYFMTETKPDQSNDERVMQTLRHMGRSVFNGGFSTFLAIAMLATSDSFIFRVFFKQFFSTVLYGLVQGLIVLPVLLALLGPAPFQDAHVGSLPAKRRQTSPAPEPEPDLEAADSAIVPVKSQSEVELRVLPPQQRSPAAAL